MAFFNEEFMASVYSVMERPKDDSKLKNEIEEYLNTLNLDQKVSDVIDEILTSLFRLHDEYTGDKATHVDLFTTGTLTIFLHYVYHAINVDYHEDVAVQLKGIIYNIIDIIIRHNLDPENIVGNDNRESDIQLVK